MVVGACSVKRTQSTPLRYSHEVELERIEREARVGQPLKLPAGLIVTSLHPRDPTCVVLNRAQTIKPHFVDRYSWGQIVITWAARGGYWKRLTIYQGKNVTTVPGVTDERA